MSDSNDDSTLLAKWLDNSISDEERESLQDQDLDELRTVVDDISKWKLPALDTETAYQEQKKRQGKEVKVVALRPWMSIAASLALIAASVLVFNYFSNQSTVISTGISETREVTLPNGSKVLLDTESSIRFSEKDWENNRMIKLEGQAFFEVTKGKFEVETLKGTVAVLGTEFNVLSRDSLFSVYCFEGLVSVQAGNTEVELREGEGTILSDGKLNIISHESTKPYWVDGQSKFQNELLTVVVGDLQSRFKVEIDLPDKYKSKRFTGSVSQKDLGVALRTIFTTLEIEYSLTEDNLVVFK